MHCVTMAGLVYIMKEATYHHSYLKGEVFVVLVDVDQAQDSGNTRIWPSENLP